MSRARRASASTGYYHVVNRSVQRATLFESSQDYLAFLRVLREALEKHDAHLVAYCVLSNHWHLLIGPIEKSELSKVVKWVTATHAMRWHRFRGTIGTGAVYQSRFHSTPINDLDALMPLTRYVERNARSAGLVNRAEDWRWCSLAQRLTDSQIVPLSESKLLSSAMWVHHVNAVLTPRERAREEKKAS